MSVINRAFLLGIIATPINNAYSIGVYRKI